MVITVHYIDPLWQLKKLIIGFKHITDHKGQTIANVLLECLSEWGIINVFCITVDNATANSSALRKFQSSFVLGSDHAFVLDGEFLHLRCSAHIINLIVKDVMAEIDHNVVAIRNAVSYVRSHANRLSSFELKVDSGKITRGSLPLDVKTRWNSTYLMLSTALKFKVAFSKMEVEDKLYNDHFSELENGEKRVGPPQLRDWNAIEKLCRFLVIFYNSTLVVSASTSLNSHRCYGEIVTIATNLIGLSTSSDSEMRSKATEMLKKFEKYWNGMKNINMMLIVATVFDPSNKLELAKLCFEELYGLDTVDYKEMYESLMCLLRSLFKEYSSRHGPRVDPSDQSSQSDQSTQPRDQSVERMEVVDEFVGYKRMDVRYKQKLNEIGVREKKDELETYLKESVEQPDLMIGMEYDVLSWWRKNSVKFPILSEIARDVLAIQVSSVASESAFSTSGRLLEPHRSCLTHYMVEVLMCTELWMKQDIKMESRVLTNPQILDDLEEMDKLERGKFLHTSYSLLIT